MRNELRRNQELKEISCSTHVELSLVTEDGANSIKIFMFDRHVVRTMLECGVLCSEFKHIVIQSHFSVFKCGLLFLNGNVFFAKCISDSWLIFFHVRYVILA